MTLDDGIVLQASSHPRAHWSYRLAVIVWRWIFPLRLNEDALEDMTITIGPWEDTQ